MARRRSSRNYYSRGKYRMTAGRARALKKAQLISARKRKGKAWGSALKGAGILAVGGAVGYLGHKHRGTISNSVAASVRGMKPAMANARNRMAGVLATSPGQKERVRVGNAISNGHPSRTTIKPADRIRAQQTRDWVKKQSMPPIYDSAGNNIGGPDRRKYNEDGSVDSAAMTNRTVRSTLKKNRTRVTGQKTGSLKGTPGGTRAPRKSQGSGMTDAEMDAAFGMEISSTYTPAGEIRGSLRKKR